MPNKIAGMEMPRGARPIVRTNASDSYKASQRRTAQEDARALRKLRQDVRASQRGAQRRKGATPKGQSITPVRRDKAPSKPSLFITPKFETA